MTERRLKIEEITNLTWRIRAQAKVIRCELSGKHDSRPVLGQMRAGDTPERSIPEGFATICDNCEVVTLFNGAHLYGRKKSTPTERTTS